MCIRDSSSTLQDVSSFCMNALEQCRASWEIHQGLLLASEFSRNCKKRERERNTSDSFELTERKREGPLIQCQVGSLESSSTSYSEATLPSWQFADLERASERCKEYYSEEERCYLLLYTHISIQINRFSFLPSFFLPLPFCRLGRGKREKERDSRTDQCSLEDHGGYHFNTAHKKRKKKKKKKQHIFSAR